MSNTINENLDTYTYSSTITDPGHTFTVSSHASAAGSVNYPIMGLSVNNTTTSVPYYITDSTNGIDWSKLSITDSTNSNALHVRGNAHFDGEVQFEGLDLGKRLAKIEERLGILHDNPKLELRWADLKALGDQYRKLEQQCLEAERIVEILGK